MHGAQEAINKNNVLNEHRPFLHLKSYFLNKTQQSLLIQPCWCHLSSHFSSWVVPCSQIQVILSLNASPSLSLETFAPVPLYARLFSPAPLLLCLGNSSCSFRYQFRGLLFQKKFSLVSKMELDRLITPCDFHCGNTTWAIIAAKQRHN